MSQSEIKSPFKITGGAAQTNKFVSAIAVNGVATLSQPSVSNLSDGTTGSGVVVLATAPTLSAKNLNTIRFADQFAGADAGAKIAAAIADLPSTGGTVDARGLQGSQAISSTITLDRPVQLLLGAANFTASASPAIQDTTGFSTIIGMGAGGLVATRLTTSTIGILFAPVPDPTTSAGGGVQGLYLVGPGGSDTSGAAVKLIDGNGLRFKDLLITNYFTGFIVNDSAHFCEFNTFERITMRTNNTGDLRYAFHFTNNHSGDISSNTWKDISVDGTGTAASASRFFFFSGPNAEIMENNIATNIIISTYADDQTFLGTDGTAALSMQRCHFEVYRQTDNPPDHSMRRFVLNNAGDSVAWSGFINAPAGDFLTGGATVTGVANSLEGFSVVNVGTGFQIGGAAATSGHVLRANGTNYVDAALAAADLSNGTTGSGAVVLAGAPTLSGNVTISGAGEITATNFGAPNDTDTEMLRWSSGADGTLGALVLKIIAHPSATGSSRYITIDAGDSGADRLFKINPFGGPVEFGGTVKSNSVINAVTGYQVNGGATSGHVLRGNGTNFVDAALAASDLSNGTTGSGAVVLATAPTFSVKNLNSVRFADQFSGADLGAQINAADTDLGATAGEIWVNRAGSTTISTAVSLSANHVLRFIQGGTYLVSATITLNAGASIVGSGKGNVAAGAPPTLLQQSTGANLSIIIAATGVGVNLRDFYLDGNKANNASALDGIVASQAKFVMNSVTVDGAKRHNLVLGASTEETRLTDCDIHDAGSNGIEIQGSATDMLFSGCAVVNNGLYNVHSTGTVGGIHIFGGDYSGVSGASDAIFLDGTGGAINGLSIVGIAIAPCYHNAIHLINVNSGVISSNYITDPGKSAFNTYDGIQINNYGDCLVSSNVIVDGSLNYMRYGVNIVSATQKNTLGPNTIRGAQTANYNPGGSDIVFDGTTGSGVVVLANSPRFVNQIFVDANNTATMGMYSDTASQINLDAYQTGNSSNKYNLALCRYGGQVGVRKAPSYDLDVNGDMNTSGVYRVGGSQIAASNLSNGVTGSGAVVLAGSPTITGGSLTVSDTSNGAQSSVNITSKDTGGASESFSIGSGITGDAQFGFYDNTNAHPVYFYTINAGNPFHQMFVNGVEKLKVDSTGIKATGVANATTGFQVNGAATSGYVLRGNGTNFVDAALAAADLSNGVTGSGAVVLASGPTVAGTMHVQTEFHVDANNTATLAVYSYTANDIALEAYQTSSSGTKYDITLCPFGGTARTGSDLSVGNNVTVSNTIKVPQPAASDANYSLDSSANSVSIANNATFQPFGGNHFAGMLIITDSGFSGDTAVFINGGGAAVVKISESGGTNFSVTSGNSGTINVYLSSSVLTIENKLGSDTNVKIISFRTRTGN